MLPSLVAPELLEAICRFLKTAFPSSTAGFQRENGRSIMDDFVDTPDVLFKGPWLSLGLPFRTLEPDSQLPLSQVQPGFLPYRHQMAAFQRLCGAHPLSTLVATGTGSGKTECFMYPVMDACMSRPGPGIKAIIIYPMNALATDQARRFAKEIHQRESTRGRLRVGLFVGDNDQSPDVEMTPEYVITCKKTQRENPPDILLTNYKMLDYLLLRPKDQPLWRFNGPGVLRYLVVDELHTFDGAQGTDLACLIRRLRYRLQAGDELACVGTSATIGGRESIDKLTAYASQVFSSPFEHDAVILEDRLTAEEFLASTTDHVRWPVAQQLRSMTPDRYLSIDDYVAAHVGLWFERIPPGLTSQQKPQRDAACVALGEMLKRHQACQWLIRQAINLVDVRTLLDDWQVARRCGPEEASMMLSSLVALISTARSWRQPHLEQPEHSGTVAFVQVRYQLWLRELRRLLASVESVPQLKLSDDLGVERECLHLPVAHCRECHATAWASLQPKGEGQISEDREAIYAAWFGQHPDTRVLFPLPEGEAPGEGPVRALCGRCGYLGQWGADGCRACDADSSQQLRVWQPVMTSNHQKDGASVTRFRNDCPHCAARSGLMLMGSRAASMASVAINQLFGSTYNDDHKLITFSDSVQDAAHRAGFFGARTWRLTLREALLQALHDRLQGMSLPMVAEQISDFWLDQMTEETFVATFIAPNLEWLKEWEVLKAEGHLNDKKFVSRWIRPRLNWEVYNEFGLGSRFGRTLERRGRALLAPDAWLLDQAVSEILPILQEEIAELRELTADELQHFILGILWRMRTQGAFDHPALDSYRREAGNVFQLNRLSYLPGFGKSAQPPALLTLEKVSDRFEQVSGGNSNWYQRWFSKSLARESVLASASISQVFTITLNFMTRLQILNVVDVRGQSVWSLNPDLWNCVTQVSELKCGKCSHHVQVPGQQALSWAGAPCLRSSCFGEYGNVESFPSVTPARKRPVRLVTAEHTGLLPPDVRLSVESSFKDGKEAWDINLLSATPTMEMGIDIGDLSSVLLCSVPPAQANYLQRIGRAGRKDGNALTLTLANGAPHDLYFYADPLEMMAGTINTPGVYLNASAVLERQLIAFCFDEWTASGIDEKAIPSTLKHVLDGIKNNSLETFPNNFLGFIGENASTLFRNFSALFPELEHDDASREHLEQFLFGKADKAASMEYRLLNRLHELERERESRLTLIKELKKNIEQLQKQPQDEAVQDRLSEAHSERTGLMELAKSVNARLTLNFFTDEGLLPNYAFPEEGVRLQSVIFRRIEKQEGAESEGVDQNAKRYEKRVFEITRPSAAALSELVPESRFYGIGHQVAIDQIDLNLSTAEDWRLCSQCHYAESLVEGDRHTQCPRCGNEMWRNSAQKQTLLKLRQVYANSPDRDSRIADDSDQREPLFYNRQLLVDVDPADSVRAYRLQDPALPFGFEYLRKATFREVNFGRRGDDGLEFEVAGKQAKRPGFRICRHCGKVQTHSRDVRRNHTVSCRLRSGNVQPVFSDFYNTLYLYRELTSEAVRLLLPIAEVQSSDVMLQSLVAALHLGLKAYFGGDVSHLQITSYSEPESGDLRRHYLVILDTIPGGTGYLKQLLLEPEQLIGMLQAAYNHLQECRCNQTDQDGCYRCLYAYRESRNLELISRKAATELVGEILSRANQLEPVDTLTPPDLNALYESELEKRFVEVLAGWGTEICLTPGVVKGKPGSHITARGADGQLRSWQLEPQVELGPTDGVSLKSEADFILWPSDERSGGKPIVVYMDGFKYHRDIAAADSAKRMAILSSGRFLVWSLNWNDLPRRGYLNEHVEASWLVNLANNQGVGLYDKIASQAHWPQFREFSELLSKGSLHWLVYYLCNGLEAHSRLRAAARSRVVSGLDFSALKNPNLMAGVMDQALRCSTFQWEQDHLTESDVLGLQVVHELPGLNVVLSAPKSALSSADTLSKTSSALLWIDDFSNDHEDFEAVWRRFWCGANLFQFAGDFALVTSRGIEKGLYDSVWSGVGGGESAVDHADITVEISEAWREAFELTVLSEQLKLLHGLIPANIPSPEVGEEWVSESSEVLGELEWSWKELKIAMISIENEHLTWVLQEEGWKVILDTELDTDRMSSWFKEMNNAESPR